MKNLLPSQFLQNLSTSKKIAFIALFTALSTVCNMLLEVRILDVQYSLTITVSFVCGIFLGPVFGFTSGVLGDFIGYVINSWGQLYMPWVGISTGTFSAIAGLVFSVKTEKTRALYIKAMVFTILSFLICTLFINSGGFYFYNRKIGFSDAFLTYVESLTGRKSGSFPIYVIYRLFVKGQIFNSIANYVLVFILIPILNKVPLFKDVI